MNNHTAILIFALEFPFVGEDYYYEVCFSYIFFVTTILIMMKMMVLMMIMI